MDRNECSLCGGYFHPEHVHSCVFREVSDDASSTSLIDELEEIADRLEGGWSDGVSDSSAEEDETGLSCLLEQDELNTFSNLDPIAPSTPTPIFTGSLLDVSTYYSFSNSQLSVFDASVENSAQTSGVQAGTSGSAISRTVDNPSEHCSFRIADCSTNSSEEHLLVAGPSGTQTESLRTQEGRRFLCDVCPKEFSSKKTLKNHYRLHSGENLYFCATCGKPFCLKGSLVVHMRTHTKEKPFVCDLCSRCFSQSSHLRQHLKTHTGEKPFECDLCSRCFSQSSHLRQHLKTHTGEKPFVCDLCSRCFSQSSHLRQHLKTHTGEKPFECTECGKRYARKDKLKRHLETHAITKEEPNKCDICENAHGSQGACNHPRKNQRK